MMDAPLSLYDYELPEELIAQSPMANRADARLLVVNRAAGTITHRTIQALPEYIEPEDTLVLNNTKVVPARLVGYRTKTGGRWEGLFLQHDSNSPMWQIIGKTRGKLTAGETLTLTDHEGRDAFQLLLVAKEESDGSWFVKPQRDNGNLLSETAYALLEKVGRVPLPPYIRHGEMEAGDYERYQTVYAAEPGAVAAPTAGLHFTPELLERIEGAGTQIANLTLHVGLGTFRPLTGESLDDHDMHSEWATIDEGTVAAINARKEKGGRTIAVGTTSVRTLETAARSGKLEPFTGETDLFIRPGYEFQEVDVILTNFHLPQTTLLVLVYTFGGTELMQQTYREAIEKRYRFFSYGDAMLIL